MQFVDYLLPTLLVKENVEEELLAKANVIGVDVGFKYVNGQRTDEIAIRTYVSQKGKLPSPADSVPSHIEGIQTDVIENDEIVLQVARVPVDAIMPEAVEEGSPKAKFDPIVGGISIGPCRSIWGAHYVGTLGAIVQKNGVAYGLTNFHVICVDSQWKKGDDIAQAGIVDGGSRPADVIGQIDTACLAGKLNCESQSVDAAISTLDQRAFSSEIYQIGRIAGSTAPRLGSAVRKQGRTSDLTYGIIDGLGATIPVNYGHDIGTVTLKNQINIVPDRSKNQSFSGHGDSGSVIVDENNYVVGLLFSGTGDGSRTYANLFSDVETALGITLYL